MGKRIALIIGVDNYKSDYYSNLEGAVRDMWHLYACLKKSCKFDKVYTLPNATSAEVLEKLALIGSELDDDDVFFFYFAGHGLTLENFGSQSESKTKPQSLFCSDATILSAKGVTDAGTISPKVITAFIQESRGNMLWGLDTCRNPAISGMGVGGREGTRSLGGCINNVKRTRKDKRPAKSCVINSCADGQIASDKGEFANALTETIEALLPSERGVFCDDEFGTLLVANWKKLRPDAEQRPEVFGDAFQIAPCVKNFDPKELEKIERLRKELEESKRKNADLTSKISALEAKPVKDAPDMADYERILKELEEANRKVAEMERKNASNESTISTFSDYYIDQTTEVSKPTLKNKGSQGVFGKIKNILTPSPSSVQTSTPTTSPVSSGVVWNGTRAGERREIAIKGAKYGFCYCPPGTFMMGGPTSEDGRYSDEVQHKVTLTRGFWMLETPVTQGLWTSIMGNNPSWFCSSRVSGTDTTNFPVEQVSWEDCRNFIKKLNKLLGMTFKLPTEAQWEYACRAGTKTAYWWGDALNGDRANCNGDYPCGTNQKGKYLGRTNAVKSYDANPWGLYDCHGNVWEWCSDWYGAYPNGAVTDPVGPADASGRVCRGGSWYYNAECARSAFRSILAPARRSIYLGFRLLLE